jgi:membrane protease YdiL (CAAX protease family)
VTTLILAVVFLGEEIGWRGFLPPKALRVDARAPRRVLTGACDAIFHVPLLTLTRPTSTREAAGSSRRQ